MPIARRFGVSAQTYLRFLVLKALGAKCACCGETDVRVLVLNHLFAKEHKLSIGDMREILKQRLKVDVRCQNCNIVYEYEKGMFPRHKKLIKSLFGQAI